MSSSSNDSSTNPGEVPTAVEGRDSTGSLESDLDFASPTDSQPIKPMARYPDSEQQDTIASQVPPSPSDVKSPPCRSPQVEIINKRRKHRNSMARQRAGKRRDQIATIKRKPESEWTAQEKELVEKDQRDKAKRNKRAQERVQEQRAEIQRILAKKEDERTEQEVEYLKTMKARKNRKSLGDTHRRRLQKAIKKAANLTVSNTTPPVKKRKGADSTEPRTPPPKKRHKSSWHLPENLPSITDIQHPPPPGFVPAFTMPVKGIGAMDQSAHVGSPNFVQCLIPQYGYPPQPDQPTFQQQVTNQGMSDKNESNIVPPNATHFPPSNVYLPIQYPLPLDMQTQQVYSPQPPNHPAVPQGPNPRTSDAVPPSGASQAMEGTSNMYLPSQYQPFLGMHAQVCGVSTEHPAPEPTEQEVSAANSMALATNQYVYQEPFNAQEQKKSLELARKVTLATNVHPTNQYDYQLPSSITHPKTAASTYCPPEQARTEISPEIMHQTNKVDHKSPVNMPSANRTEAFLASDEKAVVPPRSESIGNQVVLSNKPKGRASHLQIPDEELLAREAMRNERKNENARKNQARLKEAVALIESKPEHEWTAEERLQLERFYHRKRSKINRCRELALEKKSKMERIQAIPENRRSEEEKEWIKKEEEARRRKNRGDRERRMRLREQKQAEKEEEKKRAGEEKKRIEEENRLMEEQKKAEEEEANKQWAVRVESPELSVEDYEEDDYPFL